MKKLFLLLIALCFAVYLPAQSIVVFHEDFELPSLGDSLQNLTDPIGGTPWSNTTHLQSSGLRADSNRVQIGTTVYLTTNSFSTLGYSHVSLQFAQICKLFFSDGGQIEVSVDGGNVWSFMGINEYRGSGNLIEYGGISKFSESAYPDWLSLDTTSKPTNAWWKTEIFNISTFAANKADVKIRFKYTGSANPLAAGRYGWLLDDIKVFAANNEIDPPKITFKTPVIQDSVSNTGPFIINAVITDSSIITSANLVYNVNGGSDITVAMTHTDSTYVGEVPSFTFNNTISYKIIAADQYGNQNVSNAYSFIIKKTKLIVEIASGTSNNYYAPVYINTATSTSKYSYHVAMYTKNEINTTGYIKSIAWNKANTEAYTLGNASFKIYLKEVSNTTVPSSYTDYTSAKTGATLVYSNLSQNITANTGWDTYNFNVDSFLYNAQGNLMVFVEFYRPGDASGAIKYYYTSTTGGAYTFAGTSVPPSGSYANYRPHLQLGISATNFQYDAGISQISTPSGIVISAAPVPVKVRVKNYGSGILTKAFVHWTLDGIYQGSSVWTGNLAQGIVSSEFQAGTAALTVGPHVLKSWTTLPNDSIDNYPSNDTIYGSVFSCTNILNGVYTVGDATSNFPTFADALNGLSYCGINGPVVFKIKSGTYNQQLSIPLISGTSAVNTITFESETGNRNDVIFTYAANAAADNWVVKLDGSYYIKLKNISIEASGITYGRGVELALDASYNRIEGCKILMPLVSASSVNFAGIYSTTTLNQYNTIKNNEILNGSYGIYNYGTSATVLEKGNVIEGNTINGFYSYGITSYYQDSVTINGNIVENGTNAAAVYGIYANSNDNLLSISKNKVNVYGSGTSAIYGITLSSCVNTSAQPGIVANNFISQSIATGTTYGLYLTSSNYQKLLYNSVNITAGSVTTGRALYTTSGSNIDVYNNIFSNTGGGYAYYINTVAAIVNSNYNNVYTTGTNVGYWSAARTDLTALKTASGKDANSITVNPGFISLSNLHVNNPLLDNAATPILAVADDIDGDIRNATTPDIGADEFLVIANDAGISELTSPVSVCSGAAVDVIVKLKNYGINTLTAVSIKWEVNGVLQPNVNFTGSLPTLNTANVLLSAYTFLEGNNYTIKAWVESPNNLTDDNNANDTLTVHNFYTSLSGSYTIGSVAANYATINLAVSDLILKGVCGPTIFNILPGTYNENIEIPEIARSSAINTITFQSSNGDSTSVIINYASSNANDNYVMKLNGADNIIIKNLSLQNNGGAFSRVIELGSFANNNKILSNIIKSSISTATTSAGIYNASGNDQFNIFKNNNIFNGYYGIYNYGTSTSSLEKGNIIEGNTIKDFYYYGIYSYYQDSVCMIANTIENGSNSGIAYGIYAYYNDNLISISKNKVYVHGSGSSANYGIYVYYCDNTATQLGIIANNFISQSGTTGTVYGLANYSSTYQNYYYNSVNVTSGSATAGHAFYSTSGSNVNLANNSFSNTGGGYAYYISTIAAILNSDYNNLYASGNNLAYWTTAKTDLTALQSVSGKDLHSLSTNPFYTSGSNLHTDNALLYRKGSPIAGIQEDIDGETRNLLNPCIGADEYTILSNDAKVKALYTLGKLPIDAGSPHFVKSIVENKGANTLYNLNVNLAISGNNTFADTHIIDSLISGEIDTISFNGFTPSNLGANNVNVNLPVDDLITNNELNYLQIVTDSTFAYTDTSKVTTYYGFNTGEGLFLSKYFVNGSKMIPSVKAFITNSNTLGQKMYGVIMDNNGVLIDTSFAKIITAADTNNWVQFNFVHPLSTSMANTSFYVGIAQIAGTTGGYYPLGCQAENPTRNETFYYTTSLTGGSLSESNHVGRFMIEANTRNSIPFDASVTEIINPNTGCDLINQTVSIAIQNLGIDTIVNGVNTLVAKYGLIYNGSLINVVSETVNASILPSESFNYSFVTPVSLPAIGVDSSYHIKAWVELQSDTYHANDSLLKTIISRYIPTSPIVNTPVTINFATNVTLNALATDTVKWYANYNDTIEIASGSIFTTSLLYDTTTYWVAASNVKKVTNFAITATATHSGGGGSPNYGPEIYNDDLIPPVGSGIGTWGWTSSNGWIEYTWTTPQTFNKVVFYKDARPMSTCTFQYWNGSAYVDFLSYNNTNTEDSIIFAPVTTTKLRFYGIAGSGNPSFREIQVFETRNEGCTSPKIPLTVIVNNIPAIDAGVQEIISPVVSANSGVNTAVIVAFRNWGTSVLTAATIGWSIDGVVQTPYIWTGNLSSGLLSAPTQIANHPFNGGIHIIKAWTSNPNNNADLYAINDTASTSIIVCMNGNFTIGSNGNFHTFNEAIQNIEIAGICGNVIFDVLPGTYNESLTINEIPNIGPNACITFRSQNGNNTSVILTNASGTSVVKLNGADYIRFEKITIQGGGSINAAVELSDGAINNIFDGNILEIPSSTTSAKRVINSTATALDNYNQFINNNISGGYYGIYWYGSSSLRKVGNVFSNNIISDFYYNGLYLYYNDSASVSENTFANASNSTTVYGLNSYYTDKSIFTKNKFNISGSSTAYGMYMYYNNITAGNSLVANNFVSQSIGTGTVYGISNSYSENMSYYNNSVNVTGGSASAYSFYSTGGTNNNVVNNIFSNTGGGYAYYISTIAGINVSNYNDLYATGSNLAYWSSAKTDLAALKSASGKDTNSLSVYPNFTSLTNLHIVNFDLNGKALPFAMIADDIDGDIRNTTFPDMGADEFNLPANDAGVIAVTQPMSPVNIGSQTVKVVIKNFGAMTLTSTNIQWRMHGILQTPFAWTGSIASGNTDTISIGSYNFTSGVVDFKAWTILPNGVADLLNSNDTLNTSITTCSGPLSGNYTIGGSASTYQTINHAVQSLKYCGISGPVVFNIQTGTYNEQILIPSINGASSVNTITFKSQNNDSASVVIAYNPLTTTGNYVVKLDSAKYIKFKYLSIVNNTLGNLGRVIELTNQANNNEFSNNLIQTPLSTSSSSACIYSYNTKDERNIIANNLISGGYYGVYLYGVGSVAGSKELGNTIRNNVVKDFYYYGLYVYYQDSITIIGNTILNDATSESVYGVYSYYADNINYQKNKIILTGTATVYGLYIYYNNNASGSGLIANNFISQSVGTGTVYGIYSSTSSNIRYYYNSINVTAGGTTNRAMYFTGGTMNVLRNNSIVNSGGGFAVYAAALTNISSSDYNNLYTSGTNLGYWAANCTDLAAWKTASAKDSNSISENPDYLTVSDLHVYIPTLNNLGIPLTEVNIDIDGQVRSATTPDIGADEYAPLPFDIGVTAIIEPVTLYSQVGGNIQIKCRIKNYGADSVANFSVFYKAGNTAPVEQLYTAYLQSNHSDTVVFTTLMPIVAGPFEIKVFTSLLNDGNQSNDTVKINYFGASLKNIPYVENFDNTTDDWFTLEPASLWEKGIPTASVINTSHSAPNVWATQLNGIYTNNNSSVLYSPIFNNAVFTADTLKFWHWVDAENNKDGCQIEYMNNSGSWIVLGTISPDTNAINWYNGTISNMWTGINSGWQQSVYKLGNLSNLGNTLQFRFIFTSDATNNNYDGWAIDDFELTLAPIPADAGVIAIASPTSTSMVGDIVTVAVTVKNFGSSPLVNIPVKYQVANGGIVTGTIAGPLVPGATASYTFAQTFQVANNNYTICASTAVVGDIYTQNDNTCMLVTVNPAAHDVAITEILQPGSSVGSGSTPIKVVIKNLGTTTQTLIPISYQRGATTIVNETWAGSLVAGADVEYTFITLMNVPNGSSFSLCAYTRLANDAYIHNDTICKSVAISNGINDIDESAFWLGQNMPNPTTGITNIEYMLPFSGEVRFDIINFIGQKVYTFNKKMDAGKHLIDLNVNDLSAGIYYYTLEFKGKRLLKKMVVNK